MSELFYQIWSMACNSGYRSHKLHFSRFIPTIFSYCSDFWHLWKSSTCLTKDL